MIDTSGEIIFGAVTGTEIAAWPIRCRRRRVRLRFKNIGDATEMGADAIYDPELPA